MVATATTADDSSRITAATMLSTVHWCCAAPGSAVRWIRLSSG